MAYGSLAEVIKEDIFEGYLQAMRKVCGILNSGGSHPKTFEILPTSKLLEQMWSSETDVILLTSSETPSNSMAILGPGWFKNQAADAWQRETKGGDLWQQGDDVRS